MLCSEFHCQKGFNSILFSYEITVHPSPSLLPRRHTPHGTATPTLHPHPPGVFGHRLTRDRAPLLSMAHVRSLETEIPLVGLVLLDQFDEVGAPGMASEEGVPQEFWSGECADGEYVNT